ncbi:bifunctional phosphopantothenoylcysteine decarboxylase/phosphopantothenate--cysteine ligase CoaBC [Aeromicrobium wangtongii]|uniref:Coenzyme A biosynthesis bifunctional protein CoaBC n=1 Tax=Aeromicrobium wangtongii TaxID=2969247 RepID=A0ABY5M1X5_9ACTN|nr:bifunctional phosphopantothenoylcysteine decarboxylase/phosphopantothenate--cysteine ligase CoaBC [Aeromicrobium wangtongii]MCD9198160.1 bifunctional phosphopantothenoylcysteine decarboxylase/phosphopantothenate--cysteine ligase CoaBC [Aeromicrobium wangtongii]UUP12199.1 bifunctional phosphopantothenoylcysteine decarboxylase/phosphopantothenate--cysteine ligase CoaBC [Aeromicrobium wangtongii]
MTTEVVLGVSGGIASYKAAELLRLFTESGHSVRVVPTESSLNFVGAATWEALSGKPVQVGVFEHVDEVAHVRIGKSADLVVVAPATANTLAKAAHGLADDLLTNTLLTARCPVMFAPAMHTEMWENAATQANVATLRARGHIVLEPAVGRLTGTDTGKGRLPDPADIFRAAVAVLEGRPQDLVGRRVVISAGGTREFLDPVRFLGNRSSGRQGFALAEAAVARGAQVTVIAANVSLPSPAGVDVVPVVSTEELRQQMLRAAVDADAVVMAAAPADFRPAEFVDAKIKKTPDGVAPQIHLVENPDILVELVAARTSKSPVIVGFAAETGDATATVIEHARAKLARKGCDLLVVNDVSEGKVFGRDDTEAVVLGADGSVVEVPPGPKRVLAHTVWDSVVQRMD